MADQESTEIIRALFLEQIPEIRSGVLEIRGIAREPGVLSMVVVHSSQPPPFDAVGACVGHIKNILKVIRESFDDEVLSMVRWSESPDQFIANLVAPNQVASIHFDDIKRTATVVRESGKMPPMTHEPSASLRAASLRLASELAGWNIRLDS